MRSAPLSMLTLAALLASLLAPASLADLPAVPRVVAQADTDTVATVGLPDGEAVEETVERVERFRVRPVLTAGAFWPLGSRGIGAGGGIAMDGILSGRDHVQVEARIAQRLQGVFAEYLTGRPRRDRLFVLLGATGWTTTRTLFAGHGPHSDADGELWLSHVAAATEGRIVWAAGPSVVVQPTLRGHFDRLRGFEGVRDSSLAAVDADDLARLDAQRGLDRYGVEVAVSALRDTRDLPSMPSRGTYVQGEVARFQAVDGTGLGFTRLQATALAFRPALFQLPFIPERGAMFVRATGIVTRQDAGDVLPWIYLPDLSRDLLVGHPRRAFVGRDALSVGAGVRGVIGQALGAVLVEGVAFAQIGAAYDDVFREFTPRVRLGGGRPADGEAVPLQPSFSIGLNLHTIDNERPLIGGIIGIGPEGITLASLRLVWGLDQYRPRFR